MSAFGVDHVGVSKAFSVDPLGVASRIGRRAPGKLPFLHPKAPLGGEIKVPDSVRDHQIAAAQEGPDRTRHVLAGLKAMPKHEAAPRQVLDHLSGQDLGETLGRIGRATRRQDREFFSTVHPISGRILSMHRGGAGSVSGNIHDVNRTRERAAALAERTSNPSVRNRAENVALGRTGTPKPVTVHNHPSDVEQHTGTLTQRRYPSGQDMIMAQSQGHAQFTHHHVVLTHRDDPQLARRTVATHLYVDEPGKNDAKVGGLIDRDVATQTHALRRMLPVEDRKQGAKGTAFVRRFDRMEHGMPGPTGNQGQNYDRAVRRVTTGRNNDSGLRTTQTFHKALGEQKKRKTAHAVEAGASTVAGTIGTGFAAAKLRDSYVEDPKHGPAKFSAHLGRLRTTAMKAGLKPEHANTLTRIVGSSKPGFKPLAVLTGAAGVATAAAKYQGRLKRDDAKHARQAAGVAYVAKAEQRLLPVRAERNSLYAAKHAGSPSAKAAALVKRRLVPLAMIHAKRIHQLTELATDFSKADIPTWGHVKGIGRVRVLHYHGNGHFMVMDRTDSRRLVHRDNINFKKAKVVRVAKSAFGVEDDRVIEKLSLGAIGGDAMKGLRGGLKGRSFGAAPGSMAGQLGAKVGNVGLKAGNYTKANLKPIGIGAGGATGVALLNRNN